MSKNKPHHPASTAHKGNEARRRDASMTPQPPPEVDRKSAAAGEKDESPLPPASAPSASSATTNSVEAEGSPTTGTGMASPGANADAAPTPGPHDSDEETIDTLDDSRELVEGLIMGDPLLNQAGRAIDGHTEAPGGSPFDNPFVHPSSSEAVTSRRQWTSPLQMVEAIERHARTTHGLSLDAAMFNDIAVVLREYFNLPELVET